CRAFSLSCCFDCSRARPSLYSFPTRRSSDLHNGETACKRLLGSLADDLAPEGFGSARGLCHRLRGPPTDFAKLVDHAFLPGSGRSEEHTSELQSRENLVCRLLLEKKKSAVSE